MKKPKDRNSKYFDPEVVAERASYKLSRMLSAQNIENEEQAQEFIKQFSDFTQLPEIQNPTPLEQAQEIAWEALQYDGRKSVNLARKALKICRDCSDAHLVLAHAAAEKRKFAEARLLFDEALAAAKRVVSAETLEQYAGDIWAVPHLRPYLRVCQERSMFIWYNEEGNREEAISGMNELLRLDPDDHLGVRYALISWLLAMGRLKDVERLFREYPEDGSVHWAYSRALLTYRKSGPGEKATELLRKAFKVNPFVPLLIIGQIDFEEEFPEFIEEGDISEAEEYVFEGIEAWGATEGAIEWFIDVLLDETMKIMQQERSTEN